MFLVSQKSEISGLRGRVGDSYTRRVNWKIQMRKVGDMRVGPSEKTIREEKQKSVAVKNFRAKFKDAYEKASNGCFEFLGDMHPADDQKYHSDDGVRVMLLQVRVEGDEEYRTFVASYFFKMVKDVQDLLEGMKPYLEDLKFETRIMTMPESYLEEIKMEVTNKPGTEESPQEKEVENSN